MFEEPLPDISYALGALAQEKILYDSGEEILGTPIDADYLYQNFLESLDKCADEVFMDCDETREVEIAYFIDHGITNYYRLAHEYGKRNHIHQRENPWFKKAERCVHEYMYNIGSYSYDWEIIVRRRKDKPICFIFYTYPEFYQPVQALEAIISVISFYRSGAKELKKELCETDAQGNKILTVLPNQDNRKAA